MSITLVTRLFALSLSLFISLSPLKALNCVSYIIRGQVFPINLVFMVALIIKL